MCEVWTGYIISIDSNRHEAARFQKPWPSCSSTGSTHSMSSYSQGQIGLGQAIPNFLYIQLSKMALKSFLPKTEHHS